jgi:hypothetical protein
MRWLRWGAAFVVLAVAGCGGSSGSPGASGGSGASAGNGGSAGAAGNAGSGGSAGADGGVEGESIFDVPASLNDLSEATFFNQPWPSDLRKGADGTVVFDGYPNPRQLPLISEYVDSMKGILTGFSPVASGFLRFTVPLDSNSLPATPLSAIQSTSSVQLIDIDPSSPNHGQRSRISLFVQNDPGVYWPSDTLSFMPTMGYPLRPNTRYALVVTDGIRAKDGGRIGACDDVRELLGLAPASGPVATAKAELGDAASQIQSAGITLAHVVHFTVFTTDDPFGPTATIRDWVVKNFPAPDVLPGTWTATDHTADLDVYEGQYGPSPDFQKGNIPFTNYGDGGELAFDANGTPVVQRQFNLRFALEVPNATACPMPAAGYPIALYAHGTGGDYRSFIDNGAADALAQHCIATMGIDQIFHGTRPGGPCSLNPPPCNDNEDLIFFNVNNPVAARANGPESSIDVVQQARLFTVTGISVPASISRTGSEIDFNAKQLLFMGHSQGGLNGPMFLAIDDQARGGVLSGSASMISISLLEKTQPVNVAGLFKSVLLGLSPTEAAEVNYFHPGVSLAQTIIDPSDPIHYVPYIIDDPRPGFAPKSILMTEGVNPDGGGDSYAPPHGIEVEGVALGVPPETPVIHPIAELQWENVQPVTIPAGGLSGNLAGGAASGILVQWPASQASDGHFVLFDIPAAMQQATTFMQNLAADPVGRIPTE